MKDPSTRPALSDDKIDARAYDTVLIGYPIWWDEAPRVVNTFIESQSLQGVRGSGDFLRHIGLQFD